MTNFDVLYGQDRAALVDLLQCYMPGRTCDACQFGPYGHPLGLCGAGGDEALTVDWLASEASGDTDSNAMNMAWKAQMHDEVVANG